MVLKHWKRATGAVQMALVMAVAMATSVPVAVDGNGKPRVFRSMHYSRNKLFYGSTGIYKAAAAAAAATNVISLCLCGCGCAVLKTDKFPLQSDIRASYHHTNRGTFTFNFDFRQKDAHQFLNALANTWCVCDCKCLWVIAYAQANVCQLQQTTILIKHLLILYVYYSSASSTSIIGTRTVEIVVSCIK